MKKQRRPNLKPVPIVIALFILQIIISRIFDVLPSVLEDLRWDSASIYLAVLMAAFALFLGLSYLRGKNRSTPPPGI